MSFFSDLVGGIGDVFSGEFSDAGSRFGNLGHDLSEDPWGTALGIGIPLAIAAPFAAPALFGAEALGGAGLFGAEAAGAGAGAGGGFGGGLFGFGGAEAAAGGGLGLDSLFGAGAAGDVFAGAAAPEFMFGAPASGDLFGGIPSMAMSEGAGAGLGVPDFWPTTDMFTSGALDPVGANNFWAGGGNTFTGLAEQGLTQPMSGNPFELAQGFNSADLGYLNAGTPGAGDAVSSELASLGGGTTPGGAFGPGEFSNTVFDSAARGGGGAAGGGSWWDSITGAVAKNPFQAIGAGVAAAGLGYNLMRGSPQTAETGAIGAQADQLMAGARRAMSQADAYMDYLPSGTLPAGLQASVDNAVKGMRARLISNYASRGMSTDPRQNSALMADLNNLYGPARLEMVSKLGTQLAEQGNRLLQTGINEAQLSSGLFQSLVRMQQTQDQATGQAIGNFASALGNIGRPSMNFSPINLGLGGTRAA